MPDATSTLAIARLSPPASKTVAKRWIKNMSTSLFPCTLPRADEVVSRLTTHSGITYMDRPTAQHSRLRAHKLRADVTTLLRCRRGEAR